jgi:16S rRNA (cytidine1402-2'-O)-methyltransferase
MLYVVPTPIGNLDDITIRAVNTLRLVDLILAEDTRTTKKLLQHLQIEKPTQSYHIHNEHATLKAVISRLKEGQIIALVSDAGTPSISDPGFLLIRACIQEKIQVTCLPGPTAFVPALVASGLPSDKFYFEGFLPHKKGRMTRLKFLAELNCTFIIYESPHRLLKCLEELSTYCGIDRTACVAREISKMFENIRVDNIENLLNYYNGDGVAKGEIVIVVEGKS